jgi:hypothetical protein
LVAVHIAVRIARVSRIRPVRQLPIVGHPVVIGVRLKDDRASVD